MAIRNKVYQSEYPYHICNRANNQEYLFDLDVAFPIFMSCLKVMSKRTGFRPHHFVLMSNHFHLIGSTPKANLYEFMHVFQTVVSQTINQLLGRKNHIFGQRYNATVIQTEYQLANVIKYLYQNPVRAKMVQSPFNFRYSTLPYYMASNWKREGLYLDPFLKSFAVRDIVKTLVDICSVDLHPADCVSLRKKLKHKTI